jgi:hypothetical protein
VNSWGSDTATVCRISREADFVLAKMLTGAVLVGAISDHGRPFRLGLPGAEAWEDVPHSCRQRIARLQANQGRQDSRAQPRGTLSGLNAVKKYLRGA